MPPGGSSKPSEGGSTITPQSGEDYGTFGSSESVKSELAIFDGPSYQVSHIKGQWLQLFPANNYRGHEGTNIEFKIPNNPGWYLDFNDSYIIASVGIVDPDGKPIAADAKVAFENFAIATLFKDVSFGTKTLTKIEGENQTYHYRAYLYALLNGSYSSKKFQLSAGGWDPDEAGKYDDFDATSTDADIKGNMGYHIRRQWTKNNTPLQVAGQVFLDTWLQKQYFLDGQEFDLTFKLNDPALVLHATPADKTKYKVKMNMCRLFLRQVNVSQSVLLGHAKGLQNHNCIVPYVGHKIFTKLITAGGQEERAEDFFHGTYPKCVILGLVEHEAYCGSYHKNPYNFQHFNLTHCGLTVNGIPTPSEPYTPNFATREALREYYNLFLQLGKPGVFNDDNGITYQDFLGGCTLYSFNLAADLSLSGHAQMARLSNIDVTMKFSTPVPKPLQLVGLAIYDTSIEMTADRRWLLDPSQNAN